MQGEKMLPGMDRSAITIASCPGYTHMHVSKLYCRMTDLVTTNDVDGNKQVGHGDHPLGMTNAEDDIAHDVVAECPVASTRDTKVAPGDYCIGHIHSTHHGDGCVLVGLGWESGLRDIRNCSRNDAFGNGMKTDHQTHGEVATALCTSHFKVMFMQNS